MPVCATITQWRPIDDVVADLDLVVDLGALADDGVPDGAAIDRCSRPDLHVVLNDDTANLRNFAVAASAPMTKPKPSCPIDAFGMDDDAVADQRMADAGVGPDRAIATDPDIAPDHRAGTDDGARSDLRPRPDHRPGIDRDPVLHACRRMHGSAGRNAGRLEQRGRPQRTRKQRARDLDKRAIGLAGNQQMRPVREYGRPAARRQRHAPAAQSSASPANLALSRNTRSPGPARSIAAIPEMRRSRSAPRPDPHRSSAAISATVSPCPGRKKDRSLM